MINLEKLMAVKTIVVHKDCPDGTASAILLKDALPDATVHFMAYGTPEHSELSAEPNMLFCDFTPPIARAEEFRKAGTIVLDHHADKRELVASFGDLGVFADINTEPGVSGATLAFREVWDHVGREARPGRLFAQKMATLAGIRDTWQKDHPDWVAACEFSAVLFFIPAAAWLTKSLVHLSARWESTYEWLGPVLVAKKQYGAKVALLEGYGHTSRLGTKVVMISTIETSDAADILRLTEPEIDLLVGFRVYADKADGAYLQLSMRSRGGYDCSALARRLSPSGGGHKAAAGCLLKMASRQPVPPYQDATPYALIAAHIDVAEGLS